MTLKLSKSNMQKFEILQSKNEKLILTLQKSKPKTYMEKERVRASVSPEQKLKLHFKTTKNFEKLIFISYL